jgi:hypothetical protein
MSDSNSKNARLNPYDLPAIRRGAPTATPKVPVQMRQPYTLSASERLTKSTVVLRPRKLG